FILHYTATSEIYTLSLHDALPISATDVNDPVSGTLYVAEVPNNKKFSELKIYSEDFVGDVTHIVWKDESTILFSADEGVNTTFRDRKSTRLNSSHVKISYAVFCLK